MVKQWRAFCSKSWVQDLLELVIYTFARKPNKQNHTKPENFKRTKKELKPTQPKRKPRGLTQPQRAPGKGLAQGRTEQLRLGRKK